LKLEYDEPVSKFAFKLRRYLEAVEKLSLKRKAVVREFDGMVDDGNQVGGCTFKPVYATTE